MSTWLSSLSLTNPFKSDSDDEDTDGDYQDNNNNKNNSNNNRPSTDNHSPTPSSPKSPTSPTSGVRQDISALSQTFSNHLRGVAAFLAPPPTASPQPPTVNDDYTCTSTSASVTRAASSPPPHYETITGIKKDLEEIGGSFKSLLSSSSFGISKFASNLLQFRDDNVIRDGEDYDDLEEEFQEDIPGINEEVVDFVQKISLRPELWTDFPLSLPQGFEMSDSQRAHAATIEEFVPSLLTLRQTCGDMSDGQFWMIYFILLLPRLNEIDVELLSTSEIVEVRETLLKKLKEKRDAQVESSGTSETCDGSAANEKINSKQGNGSLSEPKDVSAETTSSTGDREVETGKLEGELEHEDAGPNISLNDQKYTEVEDDVSFSDLEDDENDLSDRVSGFRPTQSERGSSASESNEWVRLTENSGAQVGQNKSGLSTMRGKDSEGEESSDWLTVDDSDTDPLAGTV